MRWLLALLPLAAYGQVAFTVDAGGCGLTALTYGGVDVRVPEIFLHRSMSYRAPGGALSSEGSLGCGSASSAVKGSSPESVTHVYRQGGAHQVTLKVEYTLPDSNTFRRDVYITNQSPTETLYQWEVGLDGVKFTAAPPQCQDGVTVQTHRFGQRLYGYMDRPGERAVLVYSGDLAGNGHLEMACGSGSKTDFSMVLKSTWQGALGTYADEIAPGQTRQYTVLMKFASSGQTETTFATPAYTAIRTALPYQLRWPDRRPLAVDYISNENTLSATNPRGYLWDAGIDVSNTSAFQTALMARTNANITRMNAMVPKPQGIIVWDLEGNEFFHALTYIGAPNRLAEHAPEIDAVADQMFAAYRAAGYRVGVTLRPQTIQYGTSLPATCTTGPLSSGSNTVRDVFLKTDAAYQLRGYQCSSTNTWTQGGARGPYYQTHATTVSAVVAILRTKIQYAINRWGVSIFYVDTNVNATDSTYEAEVFRQLATEFPGVLILPEWQHDAYHAVAAPYDQIASLGVYSTVARVRAMYPQAFSYINAAGADLTGANLTALSNGIKAGDVVGLRGWFDSEEITPISQAHAAAQLANSSIVVTNSATGRARSFSASPGTAYTYPLRLRVYFASSSGGLAASTTYCDADCTLNLTGLTHHDRRYYDFEGTLVSRGLPETL